MTAIVTVSLVTTTAIVTVTHSPFCDCVQVATSTVTLAPMMAVTRSKRVLLMTVTMVTSRLAHDGHNCDQFFSSPGAH